MAKPTVTQLIATSPLTPPDTLRALLVMAAEAADGAPALTTALASNPGLSPDQLESLAARATSQSVRAALVANPAATHTQVLTWVVTGWRKPQMAVLRAAIRRVPDPDGFLAQHALRTQNTLAILLEIISSPNTNESSRVDAALLIAARPRVKLTESAKIMALARRDAATLERFRAVAVDGQLRTELDKALNSLHRGEHTATRHVRARTSATLAGWFTSDITEEQALHVLAQDRRSSTWRAAANACRPGWRALARAVMDDARRRDLEGSPNGRTNAIALLRNPAVETTTAFEAALLVAADPVNVSYEVQSAITRVAHTHARRVRLAEVARSEGVVSWLAMREPDLPAAAVNNLAHVWSTGVQTSRRRFGHMTARALLARTELSDEGAAELIAALSVAESGAGRHDRPGALPDDADVLALPWHDEDAMRTQCRGPGNWSTLGATELLWFAVHRRRSALADAPAGTDPLTFLGDLPAAVLRLAPANGYSPVVAGAVAQIALTVAGTLPGAQDAATVSLRILEMVADGFPGTLAELNDTLRVALAA